MYFFLYFSLQLLLNRCKQVDVIKGLKYNIYNIILELLYVYNDFKLNFRCGTFNSWQYPCFPILFDTKGNRCSKNGRSFATCTSRAYIDDREQMNALTAFIDGSQIYGSEVKLFNKLRDSKGMYLTRILIFTFNKNDSLSLLVCL